MRIGGLKQRIGADSKVGCVLGIDFKKVGQGHGQSFMSHDVYGHICAITGAVWNLDGRKFDGADDYIRIPDSSPLSPATITVEAKAKLYGKATYGMIVSKRDSAGTIMPYELIFHQTNDRWHFQVKGEAWYTASDIISPQLGTWYHVVGVMDGANVIIYRDRVKTVGTALTALPTNTANVAIGRAGDVNDHYFNGTIRNARICNFSDYTARILARSIDSRRN